MRPLPLCLALCGLLGCLGAHAQTLEDCLDLSRAVSTPDNAFQPMLSGRVIGKGRLHFHTAPSTQCREKDIFIIPGDRVTLYRPYHGWYQLLFVNSKSGGHFEGWVDANRVRVSD